MLHPVSAFGAPLYVIMHIYILYVCVHISETYYFLITFSFFAFVFLLAVIYCL